MTAPRSLNSTKPFVSTAREYVAKGWGVLPLPERQKDPVPTGFTGRAGKFADDDDITNWINDVQWTKGNIGLRLGNMIVANGKKYEVIGIDIDNYDDKHGGREYEKMAIKLGELPETWTSSSRSDGVSGIRFYLVPYGYGFRGKASPAIDIVQRVHRYAVVYPSWHPKTKGQYFWYPPGFVPDGQGFSLDIPSADQLPILPDGWIDYLTRNRMSDNDFGDGHYGIDLDIRTDELFDWVTKKFNAPLADEPGGQCGVMKKAVESHISKIESSSSNHDMITNAHWHILHLACEGHSGWESAIEEINSVWLKDIAAKDKRPADKVSRELKRSFEGSLRKIKAKADSFAAQGFTFFSPEICMDASELNITVVSDDPPNWVTRVPLQIKGVDPVDYDKNDVGQANHFYDRVGDNARYLGDYKAWIIYDGITWHMDDFSHIRDLFHRAVVETSKRRLYGDKKPGLQGQLEAHLATGGTIDDAIGKPLVVKIKKLQYVSDHYGNDNKIRAALTCMASIPGVSMKFNELNADTSILAMPNGKVVKLDEPTGKPNPKALGFKVIDNAKEYYTTMSTAVAYTRNVGKRETALWKNYLDLFLPDPVYRAFVQKALGYILIGGNPEKLALFLVGPRNTGKTTMINAMMAALGDYGETFQPNSVFKDAASGLNPELGNLLHKRGIFSSESGSQRIYANPLKRNTGGDKISITRKNSNSQIIGIPQFVPIVATNQSPTIDDADEALIKRIMVLPFNIQVDDSHNDKRADITTPRDAKHAVLSWLIMGYRRYIRESLTYAGWHDDVKAATLEFASELSDVATFLNSIVEVASDDIKVELSRDSISAQREILRDEWGKISVARLYEDYLREVTDSNQKPMTKGKFGKKVKQMFGIDTYVKKVEQHPVRNYLGLKWRNQDAMSQIKSLS